MPLNRSPTRLHLGTISRATMRQHNRLHRFHQTGSHEPQVALMRRTLLAGFAAALILGTLGSAQAQNASAKRPQAAEAVAKALVDRKIEVVKTTLGLTPEQQKLWPAVEEAIRSRAAMRITRISKLV